MRLHHVALRTDDLPRLLAFYAGALGLDVRLGTPDERRVWLTAGETVLMLERREPGEPGVPAGSMELVAFAVGAEEREAWVDRLAAHGVAVEARTAHTLYFRDPDGRRVAVSSYPFAS